MSVFGVGGEVVFVGEEAVDFVLGSGGVHYGSGGTREGGIGLKK